MTKPRVLGIDVGGTSIKALLIDSSNDRLGEWREPTPLGDPSGEKTVALLTRMVELAQRDGTVDAVGLVVPGIVDDENGIVIDAVNLGWRDVPMRAMASASIRPPLAFGQDVRAGALAESTTGAGAGAHGSMLFVPIGTGLASALIVDGSPASRLDWPGEIGQSVIADGRFAGLRVEEIASAAAIARRAGATNAHAVAERVRRGDPIASAAWTDAVDTLADALAGMIAAADPGTIVLGGGLAESGDLLLEPVRIALDKRIGSDRRPTVTRATHGDAAAMIGAGILARRMLERGTRE